ncbi:hypothetical protein QQS21_010996 [Conoideocrella luteorostrata]|uniref:Uncharacterized protein n=1 Tax=Conoideocrella luteorostrata TaxID=1105319 RepID=A0AAJ0FNY1_9HYPO|nr:hypothetical protein QQS21_010996 [Conoideocrella luteorostrata]
MEGLNDKDIQSVIQDRLRDIPPEEKRQKIENIILSKAKGAFQWAILVVSIAIDGTATGTKAEKLYERLSTVTETLNELYKSILGEIPEAENRQTAKLFQLVLFAGRPLCAQELREALGADHDMVCSSIIELRRHDSWADSLEEFEICVKHISRGIVEFHTRDVWEQYGSEGEAWNREAQFIHQSVADHVLENFLSRPNRGWSL